MRRRCIRRQRRLLRKLLRVGGTCGDSLRMPPARSAAVATVAGLSHVLRMIDEAGPGDGVVRKRAAKGLKRPSSR